MAVFLYIYEKNGWHTHVSVFSSKGFNYTFAKCGDLVFLNDEWEAFVIAMEFVNQRSPEKIFDFRERGYNVQ